MVPQRPLHSAIAQCLRLHPQVQMSQLWSVQEIASKIRQFWLSQKQADPDTFVQYPLVLESLELCSLARHPLVEQVCGQLQKLMACIPTLGVVWRWYHTSDGSELSCLCSVHTMISTTSAGLWDVQSFGYCTCLHVTFDLLLRMLFHWSSSWQDLFD